MARLRATRKSYLKEALSQEKRIKGFLRRATKRGYMFPENIMPKRPDVINKEYVEKLRELTAPSMYKEAHWVDPTTGEYMSGYQGRKSERRRAARKGRRKGKTYKGTRYEQYDMPEEPTAPKPYLATETPDVYSDAVIRNFKGILKQFNAKGAGVLSEWIDHLIKNFGEHEVAVMLEAGAQMGLVITYDVVYAEQLTREYMSDMVQYIGSIEPEDIDSFGQDFYDALEEDDNFTTYE